MKPPWSILFWYKLNLALPPTSTRGIITSYQGVTLFLTLPDHIIGINDGVKEYLGPVVTGLESSPWVHYGLTNDGSNIMLCLNGERVLEVSQSKLLFKLERFHIDAAVSHRPIIQSDLSVWVTKRDSMFKIQQQTSNQYRLLTPVEQSSQLASRMEALKELLKGYHSGKKFFLADILANLRSLIFYKEGSRTYDPLLLRVAAIRRAPLPVYGPPATDELQKLAADTRPRIALSDFISLEPAIPNVRQLDFQEFLESPSLIYDGQNVSPLALIEMVSTTQSTAHFDQRVCTIADALDDTPIFSGRNTLESFITNLAQIVLALGDSLINPDNSA